MLDGREARQPGRPVAPKKAPEPLLTVKKSAARRRVAKGEK